MFDRNNAKPRVGISSCLMGMPARYTGGHASNTWFLTAMASHFQLLPVCPEIGAGMGVPREPVRLVMKEGTQRVIGRQTGTDHTEALEAFSSVFLQGFGASIPHGFILKKKSPSCGLSRIPIYEASGKKQSDGSGVFAAMLTQAMPLLPVEEEGRLNDAGLRTNFIERVYAYRDWHQQVMAAPTAGKLVAFQTRQKLALMARSPKQARRLGQLVAGAKRDNLPETLEAYAALFFETMRVIPSAGKHANVLQHLLGYLKHDLDHTEKREVLGLISQFQRCLVPLSVPLTLLRHHLRKLAHPWVETQTYLQPYPESFLMHQAIGR